MRKNVGTVNGYIRAMAVADQQHPLQTRLSLILTDFMPNGNKMGIPTKEKENIIKSAFYAPIKINFNGTAYSGHTGAIPIGPIINVYDGQDNGRDVIFGDAVLWNDIYEDIDDHLKAVFAEGIGTSWEIYYSDAEVDDEGTAWLNDCVFAGTCIVEVPAYGPNRTRMLAIAETLNGVKHEMPNDESVETQNTEVQSDTAQAEDLSDTRTELNDVQDLLFKLWEGLDNLYTKTFEIEQATVETDIGKIAETFAEKIAKIADRIGNLTEKLGLSTAELETITNERDQLKREKEEAELAATTKNRKARLAEIGIEITEDDTEKLNRYLGMSEDVFSALIADFSTARKPANAEQKSVIIPEPLSQKKEYSIKELAAEIKRAGK